MVAATEYAPTLYQTLLSPYSLLNIVAVMKAVAVCPDGKELRPERSGRISLTEYFSPLTREAIMAAENASDTSILPHELRLLIPAAFIPTITAAGAYCR